MIETFKCKYCGNTKEVEYPEIFDGWVLRDLNCLQNGAALFIDSVCPDCRKKISDFLKEVDSVEPDDIVKTFDDLKRRLRRKILE